MFNGQNLLDVMGQNYGEYARKLMKIIFSAEDLKTRILPPARGHLAREAFEQSSFNLLLGIAVYLAVNLFHRTLEFLLLEAVRVKYRFDKALFGSFYKVLLRRKLSDFLLDERRREERREERQRTRTTAVRDDFFVCCFFLLCHRSRGRRIERE